MTQEEFQRIYLFLIRKYGIDLSTKKEIVQGRLENYVKGLGYSNYQDYMNAVERDVTRSMETKLVDILTTNHTFFMREADHFDYFKQVVLPQLKIKEKATRDLCIWCGASSTGEEPYTLAMILKDFFSLEQDEWDTKVLATDVSTEVLGKAVTGVYTDDQIEKMPSHWKRYYFKPVEPGKVMVRDTIKDEVIFRKLNLMDPFPFKRKMHVIFLRNVMIYFNAETKKNLIQRVYDQMEDGGYLFIGKTESLDGVHNPFVMVRPSIYQKRVGE